MAAARPRSCGSRSASSRRTRGRRRCSAGRPPPGRGESWRAGSPTGGASPYHDHASRQPGRPLRRSRAAARRWPSRGRRPAGPRPDARDGGARVRLARRDRGLRRPPPDDPAAQRKRTMRLRTALILVSLAPGALAAQEPTDTVTLRPVVVTATRVPTPADAVTAAVTVKIGRAHV